MGGGLPKLMSSLFAPAQLEKASWGLEQGERVCGGLWPGRQAPSPTPSPPALGGLLPRGQQPHRVLFSQPFNHGHKVAKFCYADKVSPW